VAVPGCVWLPGCLCVTLIVTYLLKGVVFSATASRISASSRTPTHPHDPAVGAPFATRSRRKHRNALLESIKVHKSVTEGLFWRYFCLQQNAYPPSRTIHLRRRKLTAEAPHCCISFFYCRTGTRLQGSLDNSFGNWHWGRLIMAPFTAPNSPGHRAQSVKVTTGKKNRHKHGTGIERIALHGDDGDVYPKERTP
jgi:hypothetical protein